MISEFYSSERCVEFVQDLVMKAGLGVIDAFED